MNELKINRLNDQLSDDRLNDQLSDDCRIAKSIECQMAVDHLISKIKQQSIDFTDEWLKMGLTSAYKRRINK